MTLDDFLGAKAWWEAELARRKAEEEQEARRMREERKKALLGKKTGTGKKRKPVTDGNTSLPPAVDGSEFSIVDSGDYRIINGVLHRGSVYEVKLAKDVFKDEKGKVISQNQDAWAAHNIRELDPGTRTHGLMIASGPLYMSVFDALHHHKNHKKYAGEVEATRDDLEEKVLKPYWILTMSRSVYNNVSGPSILDRVIHNYKMPDQYENTGVLVGVDGYLDALLDADTFCNLELELPHQTIITLAKWLVHKRAYASRINNRPQDAPAERALAVGVDCNVNFNIDANAVHVFQTLGDVGHCRRHAKEARAAISDDRLPGRAFVEREFGRKVANLFEVGFGIVMRV